MDIDYQVTVVGAGITGASIAARLASQGLSVALLDQGSIGGLGASGISGGLVRLYDLDPLLMQLTAHALQVMQQAPFAASYSAALRRTGVLYRAGLDQQAQVRAAVERHASAQYPMLQVQGHAGFAARADRIDVYEPHACIGDVRQASASLAGVVRSAGLVLEHCRVEAIDWQADGSAQLRLGELRLRSRVVVLATGAWTRHLAPELGLECRAIPLARLHTERAWALPVIDAPSGSYAIPLAPHLVQSGGGLRARGQWPEDLPAPDARHSAEVRERVRQLAGAGQVRVLDIVPGFDSYSADGRPLLGFVDEQRGLYVACGQSGVGFKFAPALADIAARQLQGFLRDGQREPEPAWAALCARRGVQS